jgi:Ni/Co efflux regulator RcnB
MFKKLLIPALIVASISSMAVAQYRGHDKGRDDHNRGDNMQRGNDNHGNDNRGGDNRFNDNRGGDRGHNNDRGGPPMAQNRGAGPGHDLRKGGRLPSQYRNRQYVVNDWRGHHLSAPPRGYQWVQTGGDYVLVAAATGLIASILLNQ